MRYGTTRTPAPIPWFSCVMHACAVLALMSFAGLVHSLQFFNVGNIPAPTGAAQLIYAPLYHALVIRNSASAIAVVNIQSQGSTTHFAKAGFADMALSPSGRYVFGADYGGESTSKVPLTQSYVHRLDLSSNSWEIATAYISGNIQSVADNQIILKSRLQSVAMTNNLWIDGLGAVVPINAPQGGVGPAYQTSAYAGDFRYVAASGRLLHGDSGLTSQEIRAYTMANNNFVLQERSGVYGSAQGYGGSYALATDGSAFYYGRLKVNAQNVTQNLAVFPEMIYAATADIAFGNGNYYDAHSGELLGSLGFQTKVYGLNPNGQDFWAYDASRNLLHHFTADAPALPASACTPINGTVKVYVGGTEFGFVSATATAQPGSIEFNPTPGDSRIAIDVEDFTIRMFNRSLADDAQFSEPTTYIVGLESTPPLSITGVSATVNGVTGSVPTIVSYYSQQVRFTVTGTTWHGGDEITVTLRTACPPCNLDVDGNNRIDGLTDGLILMRAMFGLTGTAVTRDAVGIGATRADWATIGPFLNKACGAATAQ